MADLVVDNISKQFPTRSEALTVLRGVCFEMNAGENLAVLGPSGCGKSTLLHIIGTLDRPSSGSVRIAGEDPFGLSEGRLADFRNRNIGFVFQDHYLLPQCSVLENVLLPAIAHGNASEEQAERAKELLERVGLKARMDHRPAELSGGEKQRTAIARALILNPTLLLADEPTGNLDQSTAESVADVLFDLHRQEKTMMIVVTHSHDLANQLSQQWELNNGQLVESVKA